MQFRFNYFTWRGKSISCSQAKKQLTLIKSLYALKSVQQRVYFKLNAKYDLQSFSVAALEIFAVDLIIIMSEQTKAERNAVFGWKICQIWQGAFLIKFLSVFRGTKSNFICANGCRLPLLLLQLPLLLWNFRFASLLATMQNTQRSRSDARKQQQQQLQQQPH